MCGRYFLTTPGQVLSRTFETSAAPPSLAPRWNIAPTQEVAIVRSIEGGGRELALVTWGLVPSWAKERAIGNKLINARGETLPEKPSFRDSFKKRRCLVLADGFYEWQKVGTAKQPWAIRMADGEPFGIAGLWSSWRDPATGEPLETCTIVTTTPNERLAPIHDRMPVILPPAARGIWLDPASERAALEALIAPYDDAAMAAFPVSRRVNSPANDDPRCLEPVDAAPLD